MARGDGSGAGGAKTLTKGLHLLEVLAQAPDGLTLTRLVATSGTPKPTVHRLLAALVDAEMVRQRDDGTYLLGSRCLVLGSAFLAGLDLRREAADLLAALGDEVGEVCHLGILEGALVVYIDKVEPAHHALRMDSRVGGTQPAHSTGLGKVVLAHGPQAQVEEVVRAGLDRRTPATITEPAAFRRELERVRTRGYAVDDVENEDGVRCVAAPVLGHDGAPVAGISASGPTQRLTREQVPAVAARVQAAALTLGRRLGYRGELPIAGWAGDDRDAGRDGEPAGG